MHSLSIARRRHTSCGYTNYLAIRLKMARELLHNANPLTKVTHCGDTLLLREQINEEKRGLRLSAPLLDRGCDVGKSGAKVFLPLLHGAATHHSETAIVAAAVPLGTVRGPSGARWGEISAHCIASPKYSPLAQSAIRDLSTAPVVSKVETPYSGTRCRCPLRICLWRPRDCHSQQSRL